MGQYTEVFEYIAERLGYEPVTPPKSTQETIKLGVRHSSDMICFPFKATLGNLIQGLEKGADTIIVTGTNPNERNKETCRFGFYYHIQEQILRRLGYQFDTKYLHFGPSLLKDFRTSPAHLGLVKSLGFMRDVYRRAKEIEEREFKFEPSDINLGVVGEAFTLWSEEVNYDMIRKLKGMGVGVDMSITLSHFLAHHVGLADEKKHLKKEVQKYFPKRIGGHGLESITNTIDYAHKGFDGVIHLMPLSCMPESTVEMVLNMISEDYNIPIYRFPIDENNFEVGVSTRTSTFVKILRRNKG